MMTRKHFKQFADMVVDIQNEIIEKDWLSPDDVVRLFEDKLKVLFKNYNPKFDEKKFDAYIYKKLH